MVSGGRVSAAVAAVVLLPALALALAPVGDVPGGSGAATVPDRVAGYSHLTGDVSASPPGRAIALFQHGFGVEFLDTPQAVVVGADADVQRQVDLAADRAGVETQGDPAPMLLSPDGTRIAVGDHDTERPDLAVLDLRDGAVDLHPVPDGRSVVPLAWSPDGRRLAYLASAGPTDPYSGSPVTGDLGLLDLGTGRAADLPGASGVSAAAFAPGGSELAVERPGGGGALQVLALDGGPGRTLALPPGHSLDGPAAWSPDGRLLAVTGSGRCAGTSGEASRGCAVPGVATDAGISFLDATGGSEPTPEPLDRTRVGPGRVLGWTAADRVVLLVPDTVGGDVYDPDTHWVTEVPLDGTTPRRLSAVPTDDGAYGVGRFQLATGLLAGLEIREAREVDRGRWPLWLRLGAAVTLSSLAAGLAALAFRRRSRAPVA